MSENLKEFFERPRGRVNSDLLVDWNRSGFWQNCATRFPAEIAAAASHQRAGGCEDIWSKDPQFTRVQALSVAIHVAVLVLIIVPLLPEFMSPAITKANSSVDITTLSPYLPKLAPGVKKAGGGGGGGEHNMVPASKGKAPKFDWRRSLPHPCIHRQERNLR